MPMNHAADLYRVRHYLPIERCSEEEQARRAAIDKRLMGMICGVIEKQEKQQGVWGWSWDDDPWPETWEEIPSGYRLMVINP